VRCRIASSALTTARPTGRTTWDLRLTDANRPHCPWKAPIEAPRVVAGLTQTGTKAIQGAYDSSSHQHPNNCW